MRTLAALAALLLAIPLQAQAPDACAAVLPKAEEQRWLAIPWQTNVVRARLASIEKKKPMFLWVMDGHVLGST